MLMELLKPTSITQYFFLLGMSTIDKKAILQPCSKQYIL